MSSDAVPIGTGSFCQPETHSAVSTLLQLKSVAAYMDDKRPGMGSKFPIYTSQSHVTRAIARGGRSRTVPPLLDPPHSASPPRLPLRLFVPLFNQLSTHKS